MPNALYCASCGRSTELGPNHTHTASYLSVDWCEHCARIGRLPSGTAYVEQPSPGRMCLEPVTDALDAWLDCYSIQPKRRIKVSDAQREIQRAWTLWEGDKGAKQSMFLFHGWLTRHRPYFLTFRCKGNSWQRVHSWLIQAERGGSEQEQKENSL